MTRPNITPGPWLQNSKAQRIIHSAAHDPICEVNGMDEIPRQQEMANARAIAAVPALLEALENLLERSRKHMPQNADHDGLINCEALAKARQALTAAGYQF